MATDVTTPARELWRIEFDTRSAAGNATAHAVNARADDVATGRASRVEWTNPAGVRMFTQALITSYAHEFARELESNNRRGQYADVAVINLAA